MNATDTQQLTIPLKRLTPDFALPAYGLGTWGMGGTFSMDCSEDEICVQAIHDCIQMGVRHIDTAEMYGCGHAEEIIGRAIVGIPRETLFLGSKVMGHHLREDDLIAAAERSIARMGCDYLDLYMIHHPNDEIPISETMHGMDRLVDRQLVRHIGVTNFTKERLEEAQRYSRNRIVVNQVHYSLSVREPEESGLLKYCQENNILLVAWQPIDRGVYSSHTSPILDQVCARYKMTPVQVALSWLVSQPGVVVICRTMSGSHLSENIDGVRLRLSSEDVELLRKEYQPQVAKSPVYSLK